MNDSPTANGSILRLRRYSWILAACWTAAIGIVLAWELKSEDNRIVSLAKAAAEGIWKRDFAVLRWDALNGGVYVPVSRQNEPDPYLAKIPDRDITTPSGHELTIIGPVAITRKIDEQTRGEAGATARATSLKPIRPEDAPDAWERKALESFAKGESEACEVQSIDGVPQMRLMRPVVMEKACMKCHSEEGHAVGKIRGGISVSVPMASLWPGHHRQVLHRILGYGGMWLLGLCGIAVMSRGLRTQFERRRQAEQKLQELNEGLETRVAERTAELAAANVKLSSEIVERKKAEAWLLESERRFRSYFEQGLVGMAILTPAREVDEANDRLCRMLGYSELDLVGKPWGELTHAEDREAEDVKFAKLLGGSVKGYVSTLRLVRKDGRSAHVSLSVQCLKKETGAVDCVLVIVQDVNEKQA